MRLQQVVEKLAEFYEPSEIEIWLNSPNDLLGGRRATDMIAAGEIETVLEVIERLGDSAYL